jgi:hypothetical protein
MNERVQLHRVCRWNQDLARENARLRKELHRKELEFRELSDANVNLLVERDAINTALGSAMDAALEAR